MRVVAGKYKGRRLSAPAGQDLRPTADRVRESVFNVLAHRDNVSLRNARVLDGFAGTGAMGIEALSRGASHAIFLDTDKQALSVCRRNLEALGCDRACWTVRQADCLDPPPPGAPCTLVLLDPPYGRGFAGPSLSALRDAGWIATGATCVVEIGAKETFVIPSGYELVDERRYGAARAIFMIAA